MHSVHRLISLLFITVLCFFSCSKEKVAPNFFKEAVSSDDQQVSDREPISIKEARNWFTTTYGLQETISNPNTLPNTMLEVAPVWAFAQTAAYLSGPIVVCPIRSPAQAHSLARFFLIFQKSSNQIVAQVVVFRAEDGSMISGKPLTLGQFSGVIGSLDFQGNYIGAMHLIKDGKQTGEINPLLNGNGLINGDANNGNVYSQVPWWQTNGGGWNNVYVTGTHNITTSVYTSITSGAHPSSGGGTTGGGSGYTSGPPNTNPLDNHFQNLLTNPLYTLEEYLYNHNLDAGVFDYLNNTAITVLANVPALIDPINDYLVAQNSSTAARALVQMHLSTLASDPGYFSRNKTANFPLVGTTAWAETLRFGSDGAGAEPPTTLAEKILAVQFPNEALAIYLNVAIALQYTGQWYQNNGMLNGRGDAFRHAFFLALNTQDTGPIAQLFSDAHESEVPAALALEKHMDLFNNGVGIDIGYSHLLTGEAALAGTVNVAVQNGLTKYLSPLDFSGYPDTDGIIPGVTQLKPTNQ